MKFTFNLRLILNGLLSRVAIGSFLDRFGNFIASCLDRKNTSLSEVMPLSIMDCGLDQRYQTNMDLGRRPLTLGLNASLARTGHHATAPRS